MLAPQPFLVEACVADGDAGGGRQRDDDALVLLVERTAVPALGEVEVAPDLVAHADRNAEEGAHRRMVGREAGRGRMVGDVGQAKRLRVVDQLPEQALALRQRPDRGAGLLVDADGDEGGQATRAVDHAERAVAGVGQMHGDLDDAVQDGLEVQVAADGQDGLQETVHPVAAVR